jgi:AraC family transcriptional regulator
MDGSRAFTRDETHRILQRPLVRVHASSEFLGWNSIFASAQYEPPFEANVSGVSAPLLVVHIGGPARVRRTGAAGSAECIVPPGSTVIHPGATDFSIRLDAAVETVHIYLRRALLDQVATDLFPCVTSVDLLPRIGAADSLLEQLALALREVLDDQNPSSALYAEHLGFAMAARLVRVHSTAAMHREADRTRQGGLTPQQMDRTLALIHGSLGRYIGGDEVATAAGLSTLHFLRRFKLATGLPLHRYVLRARVEMAKRLLMDSRKSIAEVAFDCGFAHQEHLTRVFRTWTGITPAVFRRNSRL